MSGTHNERAQATLWLVAVGMVVAVCSVALVRATGRSVDDARSRNAADLVALAAAHGDDEVAAQVAASNGVELSSVRWVDDHTVVVTVSTASGATLTATAELRTEIHR